MQTVVCERGNVVVFASTLIHHDLCALPGVGKQIVLFQFFAPDVRHQWVIEGRFMVDPLPGAKDELAHRPRGHGPLPAPFAPPHRGQFFAFGQGLQGTDGLPSMRQFEAWFAPSACRARAARTIPCYCVAPAADAGDPMGVVFVDEGDVLWVSRLAWVDQADPDHQQTHLLQQCQAVADGPLELGFKWHAGPETRRADADAGRRFGCGARAVARCLCDVWLWDVQGQAAGQARHLVLAAYCCFT